MAATAPTGKRLALRLLFAAVLCCAEPYSTLRFPTLHYTTLLYCTLPLLYCTVLLLYSLFYSTPLLLDYIPRYSILLCFTLLCPTLPYCTLLLLSTPRYSTLLGFQPYPPHPHAQHHGAPFSPTPRPLAREPSMKRACHDAGRPLVCDRTSRVVLGGCCPDAHLDARPTCSAV